VRTPEALVLGGGGVLGEAWMSAVLAGLDESERFDSLACGGYVGTSAGSIVAAALAAGVAPRVRLGRLPEATEELSAAAGGNGSAGAVAQLVGAAAAPLAAVALRASAPGGAVVRRAALARVPAGRRSLAGLARRIDETGASWDGRLRVVVVELESGRRTVLGADGPPAMSVGTAVEASCAIPGVFRPVEAAGRTYVDGGVWSPTNLDAADVGRGDRLLCLNPTGSFRPTLGAPAGALGPVSRGIAGTEALSLRRRGVKVRTINPDEASTAAMGTNLMDESARDAVIAAGLSQGRALGAVAPRPRR
jgi:NTE family protein